ncbi:MAG: tRNA dihydrouridine(20/20a) synthase DusA [Pseudomonadota bacterium]
MEHLAQNQYGGEAPLFAVAPMMDWTDRHCRFFHRQLTKSALLYTEMVVADAVIHGNRERLLGFDECEHPVAVQLGGSAPTKLAEAAKVCLDFGYDEINLNVGCPSDRVQSGTFGACLMREPETVAKCVEAMVSSVGGQIPVTVKCRIGVDDQDPRIALPTLAKMVWDVGCGALWVHARKAWLQGLSPKQNRDVPPLDYDLVRELKAENASEFIGLNGGLVDVNHALDEMNQGSALLDGAMLGRAAYQNPGILCDVDRVAGPHAEPRSSSDLIDAMVDYTDRHIANGGRASHVARHMVGLFNGQPGARRWRQIISEQSTREGATGDVLREAFAALPAPNLGQRDRTSLHIDRGAA